MHITYKLNSLFLFLLLSVGGCESPDLRNMKGTNGAYYYVMCITVLPFLLDVFLINFSESEDRDLSGQMLDNVTNK